MSNENTSAAKTPVDLNIKLSVKERINYSVSEFGYNSIYAWISSFMAIFLTDQIGIAAAAVSFLTLFVRVFDAINDPFIGSLADRTVDKGKGKYKPWVRWGGTFMCIFIFLLFAMQPGWSMSTKIVYMWIMYLGITICSTCCNMPYQAITSVISGDPGERNRVAGMRMVFSNLGTNWNALVAVPLILFFSGAKDGVTQTARGYMFAVLVCIIIGLPTIWWSSYHVKEAVKTPPEQKKIPLKGQFASFFQNKFAIIIALVFFGVGFCVYGKMTLIIYYFSYVCGNPGLMSVISIMGLIGAFIASLWLQVFLFKVCKKKGLALAAAFFIGGVGSLLDLFVADASVIWFIFYFISTLGLSAGMGIGYSMIGDSVDFGEYKTHVRVDGFVSSFVSLMMKAGGAVGPAVLLAWMAAVGYVPNVAQGPAVINVLRYGVTVVPFACCIVMVVLGILFNLTPERHAEIREELERRRSE